MNNQQIELIYLSDTSCIRMYQ